MIEFMKYHNCELIFLVNIVWFFGIIIMCSNGRIFCWRGIQMITEEWVQFAFRPIRSGHQILYCTTSTLLYSTIQLLL